MKKPKKQLSRQSLILLCVGLVVLLFLCCFALLKTAQWQFQKAAKQALKNAAH